MDNGCLLTRIPQIIGRFSAPKALTHVVEVGSFTRAADSLGMPNVTLDKAIRQPEAHLGTSLLQCTTQHITVTPERRGHYEEVRCLLEDLKKIDAFFNTACNKPKGYLRIAIGGSIAYDILTSLLASFVTPWPDTRIDLQMADKPANLISSNIDRATRGGSMDDSTLIARKIGEATLVTCTTPGYLQRYGTPASPGELHHGHQLISYLSLTSGGAFSFHLTHHNVSTELRIEPHFGISESSAHIAAGETGLGVVRAFTYSLRPALTSGELMETLAVWRPAPYPFHVVYARHRHVPPQLRVFIGWLTTVFPAAVQG